MHTLFPYSTLFRSQIHVGAVGVSPSSSEVDADTLSTPHAVDECDDRAAQPHSEYGFFLHDQRSSRLRSTLRFVFTNSRMPSASSWFARPIITVSMRSEARRVGKEGVSRCRARWSPYH